MIADTIFYSDNGVVGRFSYQIYKALDQLTLISTALGFMVTLLVMISRICTNELRAGLFGSGFSAQVSLQLYTFKPEVCT